MRLRPRSVRIRLTFWYTAALAGIVLSFALGIYLFVRASLLRQIDGQLERDLATVTRVVRDEPNEMNELAQHGSVALFQVSEGSEVIAETAGWSRSGLEKALGYRKFEVPWSWEAPNDLHYRLKTVAVTSPGHAYLVAVAGDDKHFGRVWRAWRSFSCSAFLSPSPWRSSAAFSWRGALSLPSAPWRKSR